MFCWQHSQSKMKLLYFLVILGVLFATTAVIADDECSKYLSDT